MAHETLRHRAAPNRARISTLQRQLLLWFDAHQRDLPWRHTRDPYAIWVSEVMLQQTQVATVIPYYKRWLERFPSIRVLADADEQAVLKAWQGLGYYSRARRLLSGARAVRDRHNGRLPASTKDLLALPGIGPYSAGAIASIAFDLPEPLVDGNVVRVLTRVFGLAGDPARAPLKAQLWQLSRDLLPQARPAAFNQALMELGATLCTPKNPSCERCPVRRSCLARKQGDQERFPELAPRAKPTRVRKLAVIATRRGRVLVTQLPDNAPRWANMWWFPNTETSPNESLKAATTRALFDEVGLLPSTVHAIGTTAHSVTRYRVVVEGVLCREPKGKTLTRGCAAVRWVSPGELEALPIPSAYRKVWHQALGAL